MIFQLIECLLIVMVWYSLVLEIVIMKKDNKFNFRIINGFDVAEGKWPFMVSIQYYHNLITGTQHFCGGTILNDNTILTAAHCLVSDDYKVSGTWVYIGHVSLSKANNSFYFKAKEFLSKEDFDENNLSNGHDIGVIKLKNLINFDSFDANRVAKVCLPVKGEEPLAEQCVVLGWGITENNTASNVLKQATIPILDESVCSKQGHYNKDELLCAGYEQGDKDSCQGDSGGPLICPMKSDPKQWAQFGIVSYGDSCAKFPGFYSKTQAFIEWVTKQASL